MDKSGMDDKYDDIIDLPHPTSRRYPRMPLEERAAQFQPFAALTGFDDIIREATRVSESHDGYDGGEGEE